MELPAGQQTAIGTASTASAEQVSSPARIIAFVHFLVLFKITKI